ncbi:PD-(D/E)XK motif protein [Parasutterella excrementihominis]|uniref:PD-(D/E)XK motif protein n=1 Tax=Parasutterella excrementihominis TaxID=487175 RepID=UPI0035178F6A
MADQIYNASLIEALWEKIVPGGCVLMEGGKHPTKLIRLKDDIVGLVFQFPKNVRLGDISSLGFSVELKDEGDNKELTILKNPGSDQSIFSSLAANLLGLSFDTKEENARNRFKSLISRIKAWQKFMAMRGRKLDQKAQMGIFGELTVLEFLLSNGLRSTGFTDFWTGPLRDSHDFKINDSEYLEVKTSLKDNPFEITVDSLLQFDYGPEEHLFLSAVLCSNQEDGVNISDLGDRIKFRLSNKLDVIEFESLLMSAGLGQIEKKEELYKFVCKGMSFYDVSKLPRITPSSMHGILSAKYKITLTAENGEYWTPPLSKEEYLLLLRERELNGIN